VIVLGQGMTDAGIESIIRKMVEGRLGMLEQVEEGRKGDCASGD